MLIGITGNNCARLPEEHEMVPFFFAGGTVQHSSAAPASHNASTQGATMSVTLKCVRVARAGRNSWPKCGMRFQLKANAGAK
jgi:hypothetical protein